MKQSRIGPQQQDQYGIIQLPPMKRKYLALPLALILAAITAGCSDDNASNTYSSDHAFLKFRPVTAVPLLYTACNSLGEFVAISIGTNTFNFTTAAGKSSSYPFTAEIKNYGQPECVSGFIVGKSTQPDMSLQYPLLCYELACPNCYQESYVQSQLRFSATEELTCQRCKRTYSLQNQGIVTSGSEGRPLLQYRTVAYNATNDILVVMN